MAMRGNVLLLVILFAILFSIVTITRMANDSSKIQQRNTRVVVEINPSDFVPPPNNAFLWPKIAKGTHGNGNLITLDPHSISLAYLQSCLNDPDPQRILKDLFCTTLWMLAIDSHAIIEINQTTFFNTPNPNHFTCQFDGVSNPLGISGEWSSCIIHDENMVQQHSFVSSLIAFHIDRNLGFYHSLPVVPRMFLSAQLKRLAIASKDEMAVINVDSLISNCGHGSYIDGSLRAKLPSHLITKKVQKMIYLNHLTDMEIQTFAQMLSNTSTEYDKIYASEVLNLNIFSMFMNHFPSTSSLEYVQIPPKPTSSHRSSKLTPPPEDTILGPILYQNFNSASFDYEHPSHPFGSVESHPLSRICKFPKRLIHRMLNLKTQHIGFADLMHQSLVFYEDFVSSPFFFSQNCADHLNYTFDFVLSTFNLCRTKLNTEDDELLLFDDVWNSVDVDSDDDVDYSSNFISLFDDWKRKTVHL